MRPVIASDKDYNRGTNRPLTRWFPPLNRLNSSALCTPTTRESEREKDILCESIRFASLSVTQQRGMIMLPRVVTSETKFGQTDRNLLTARQIDSA